MEQASPGFTSFFYSNVRVRRISMNHASGILVVRAVYAEREEQKILYEGVLYSQLDQSAQGKHISLVVELSPDEYRDARHQTSAARFKNDCRLNNLDALEEISSRGYRLFSHYIGKSENSIVIAKNLVIV
jgi:hypothetical protein